MTQTMQAITVMLPVNVVERLQEEAKQEQIQVSDLVREVIEAYLDDEPEYEDTPDEEILASLKEAFADALDGHTRPAREVLEELRRELESDADEG